MRSDESTKRIKNKESECSNLNGTFVLPLLHQGSKEEGKLNIQIMKRIAVKFYLLDMAQLMQS